MDYSIAIETWNDETNEFIPVDKLCGHSSVNVTISKKSGCYVVFSVDAGDYDKLQVLKRNFEDDTSTVVRMDFSGRGGCSYNSISVMKGIVNIKTAHSDGKSILVSQMVLPRDVSIELIDKLTQT